MGVYVRKLEDNLSGDNRTSVDENDNTIVDYYTNSFSSYRIISKVTLIDKTSLYTSSINLEIKKITILGLLSVNDAVLIITL